MYCYGTQRISKTLFDDSFFRNVLKKYSLLGYPPTEEVKFLNSRQLLHWVRVEYDISMMYIRAFLKESFTISRGFPFAQGIHDTVSLKNKQKYVAVGLSCSSPTGDRNWTICLALESIEKGDGKTVAAKLKQMFQSLLKYDYLDVCHDTITNVL